MTRPGCLSEVSLYFEFISFAVMAMTATVVSRSTRRFSEIFSLAKPPQSLPQPLKSLSYRKVAQNC